MASSCMSGVAMNSPFTSAQAAVGSPLLLGAVISVLRNSARRCFLPCSATRSDSLSQNYVAGSRAGSQAIDWPQEKYTLKRWLRSVLQHYNEARMLATN
jgi:hypothetical protein